VKRPSGFVVTAVLAITLVASSVSSYDVPPRKIEAKPYFKLLFPKDFWQANDGTSIVADETAPGFGVKLRMQAKNEFGIVFDACYLSLETLNETSRESFMFTGGGYYAKTYGFGTLTLDVGYGVVGAADQVLGLLLSSFEYSRSISDRVALALELGWPIPNDWLKDFGFKENYSSFTLSLGTNILF
jgi:hypothetical protein